VAAVDFVNVPPPLGLPADPNTDRRTAWIDGHGTHVAGIVAGTAATRGRPKLGGIAPQANLVSVRVLDGNRTRAGLRT